MKKLKFFSLFFLFAYFSYSQSIGIGTTNPNGSAQVDISSSSRGLLIPRMTTILINSISNPAKGLMVYDSSSNRLMVNMGSPAAPNWQSAVSGNGWSLSGNTGTVPEAHFIGTTDDNPLMFRINYKFAGKIDSTDGHTFLGFGAGRLAISSSATAIGFKALFNSPEGNKNTAIGHSALTDNNLGELNTAVGHLSLSTNTNGSANAAVGDGAMFYNKTGSRNTALGHEALLINSTGNYNTALGASAGGSTSTAFYNTTVGYLAGASQNMGYNNTIIGAHCDMNNDGLFNTIALGQAVTVTASSQARIGNSATNSIGGFAGWTTFSDGRFKKNVQEDVKGIDFIMKLRPVTYHLDVEGISKTLNEGRGNEPDIFSKQAITEKERIVFSGFVAQDVEKAAQESGYEFSGVDKPKNEKDFYGLRYAEFVVPLVKAMQQQQLQLDAMKTEIQLLKEQNKLLLQLINK